MNNPIRLKILTEESLLQLKNNIETISCKFALPSNSWIENSLAGKTFSVETKYNFEDFHLLIDYSIEPSLTEARNVRLVYDALKDVITPAEATDERLWSWFCLDYCYDYVKYRWKIQETTQPSVISSHYFFSGGHKKTRNAIARLWWIGYYTYDSHEDNPYVYTDYLCQHSDFILHIIERNLSSNPVILKAFIKALMVTEKEGYKINTDTVGMLEKHMIVLSGTYVLDFLSMDELYDMIVHEIRINPQYAK